jgi:hypothetical protein
MSVRGLFAIGLATVALIGCSGAAEPAVTSGGSPGVASQGAGEESPGMTPGPEAASPEASGATNVYKIGEPIDVTGDFVSSDVRVTVDQVKRAAKYGPYSKPAKGNSYLAVKYTYQALEDGASYNPFDWQVFVDDTAVNNFAVVMDGPKPELSSGTLPKGRKASGWVVYEVPKTGKVVLSYGANMFGGDAPKFEVVARPK